MTPLFHHPLPEQETDEPTILNEESVETAEPIVPEGLISASELPSASQVLEDLFRDDDPQPAPAEPERRSIREELLLEEEVTVEAAASAASEPQISSEPPPAPPASAAREPEMVSEPPAASAPVRLGQPIAGAAGAETGPEPKAAAEDAIASPAASAATDATLTDDTQLEAAKFPAKPAERIDGTAEMEVRPAIANESVTANDPVTSNAPDQAVIPDAAAEIPASTETAAAERSATSGMTPLPGDDEENDRERELVATGASQTPEEVPADSALIEATEKAVQETLLSLREEAAPEPASTPISEAGSGAAVTPVVPVPSSDWALEESLACHKEWVDSRGRSGNKASFAGAELESAELIGVNLRHADLQDSNLKSADLLLADVRDACMVRTNLQEACLVGANLEGANLEGATLDTAMGLVPRQLAGANLHEASLPEQVSQFEAKAEFTRVSQLVARYFTAMMAVSAVSSLVIWKTKDLQLLADSSILPFLHSPAAASALPTAQIYLIAPVVLFIVYVVFNFHLQNLWDAVLQLPSIFPDGRELGQDGPRVITGLLRAHFRWMNRDAASTRVIERALAFFLGYWVAPLVLLLFWARYLTLQDMHGTMLHTLLAVVAFGVALYSTTKVGRPPERWSIETERRWDWISKLREVNPLKVSAGFGAILLLLAIGTVDGAPHDKMRAPQFGESNIRRWAPTVFWSLGFDPYADLTEAPISTRPSSWSGTDDQISLAKGARLAGVSFRYAQAYGAFMVNSHLWRSNFQGAFLSAADLRGADLGQSTLRYAIMDGARLYRANLDRSNLDGANLDRTDFREANLSHCSLVGSILIDAQLQNASLYGARLSGSTMERANLEKTDLRSGILDNVNLEHAELQQTYLWSAKLPQADLRNSRLTSSIFIDADLQNSDLRGARLDGTVLSGTNLSGATVDGVDFRGALGLTPAQICSTKSRNGAILTDPLAAQVRDTCGGPLLVAPTPVAVTPVPASAAGSQDTKPAVKNVQGTSQSSSAARSSSSSQSAAASKKTQQ